MGMAPCYTLHSRTILEGQQIATQLPRFPRANYFMDVWFQYGMHAGLLTCRA